MIHQTVNHTFVIKSSNWFGGAQVDEHINNSDVWGAIINKERAIKFNDEWVGIVGRIVHLVSGEGAGLKFISLYCCRGRVIMRRIANPFRLV